MNWAITYYSESVQADILALPAGLLARYLRYADRMEVHGPDLGMPHTRAMGGGAVRIAAKSYRGDCSCTLLHDDRKQNHDPAPVQEKDQEHTAEGAWHSSTAYEGGQRC